MPHSMFTFSPRTGGWGRGVPLGGERGVQAARGLGAALGPRALFVGVPVGPVPGTALRKGHWGGGPRARECGRCAHPPGWASLGPKLGDPAPALSWGGGAPFSPHGPREEAPWLCGDRLQTALCPETPTPQGLQASDRESSRDGSSQPLAPRPGVRTSKASPHLPVPRHAWCFTATAPGL